MFLTSSKIIKHRNNVRIKFIFIYIYINIDNIFRKEIYEIKLIAISNCYFRMNKIMK